MAIAKRTGAPVVAITELAGELGEEGVDVRDPNMGGTVKFDWGSVKLVPAWHTSTTPKGTVNTPAGLLINFQDTIVYHLGDTCVFGDLQLVGKRAPIDVALMCIGGHYTMDRVGRGRRGRARGREDRDPLPLQHVPADRDRRGGVQVRRRVGHAVERRRPRAGRVAHDVTHAIVLIQADRAGLATLGGELADLEGVAEAYSVTGEWDFVAVLRLRQQEDLAKVVTGRYRSWRGWRGPTRWSRSRSTPATTSRHFSPSGSKVRVAVVAEWYPSPGDPVLGIWAHRQAMAARDAGAQVRVLALRRPIPPLSVARQLFMFPPPSGP